MKISRYKINSINIILRNGFKILLCKNYYLESFKVLIGASSVKSASDTWVFVNSVFASSDSSGMSKFDLLSIVSQLISNINID